MIRGSSLADLSMHNLNLHKVQQKLFSLLFFCINDTSLITIDLLLYNSIFLLNWYYLVKRFSSQDNRSIKYILISEKIESKVIYLHACSNMRTCTHRRTQWAVAHLCGF